jgi:hypothetical protein
MALVFTLAAGLSWAEDAKPPQSPEELAKAFAEAGQPGPEHAKLQPLVGSWTYTSRFWMDPDQPPVESKGTIERDWILGGRFLEERVTGEGFDGKPGFEARGLIGYDNGRRKYTASWVSSMCTGSCLGLGEASERTLTFQTEAFCPIQKKVVKGRDEMRIENENRTVAASYHIVDGKEIKMMEIVAVRKE